MRFAPTELPPVTIVELEPSRDDRGWFARAYCTDEFTAAGLEPLTAQTNLSHNAFTGTVRGLHWQDPAIEAEAKLVRCVRGVIYDVAVDLREGSETFGRWVGVELSADNGRALYVPPGFAHGFQTLADDTLVTYQVSGYYTPAAERGARHDDPILGIDWPRAVTQISDKDRSWSLLSA